MDMMIAKRFLATLLSLTLIATAFAGCGGSTDNAGAQADDATAGDSASTDAGGDDGAGAATPSGDKTTVEFWHSMSGRNGELIDELAANFNKVHDDIQVVPTFQGSYWESASKAQAAVAAGDNPDVLMMGADHVSIFASEEGLLTNLLPLMGESGIDPDDFVDAFIWDYYVDDELIALPFGRSTPVMYVNNELFAETGESVPTNWDELQAVATAMIERDGDEVTRYGVAMPYDTWYFFMIVAQAGGSFINAERTGMGCLDDGTALEGYTFWQNLHNSDALYFGPTIDSGSTTNQVFIDGKSALLINSIGSYSTIKTSVDFDFSVAWVPEGKERVVPTGGCAVVLLDAAPQKEAAWEFMRWVVQDPEGGLFFNINTGYLPYTYSMTESDAIKELWAGDPNYEIAFGQLEYASDRGHRVPQVGTIMNELFTFIEAIMYDNEDVQTQLDILAGSVADIMQE